ncbi:MAG: hypothetical protein ACE5I1_03365 [bacterium]
MISGKIEKDLYPRLGITLHAKSESVSFKALVDSGFDGELALPYSLAFDLKLKVIRFAKVTYANGQKTDEILCRAEIDWHDQRKIVEVLLSHDDEPAIGTALLQDHFMTMDFKKNVLAISSQQ